MAYISSVNISLVQSFYHTMLCIFQQSLSHSDNSSEPLASAPRLPSYIIGIICQLIFWFLFCIHGGSSFLSFLISLYPFLEQHHNQGLYPVSLFCLHCLHGFRYITSSSLLLSYCSSFLLHISSLLLSLVFLHGYQGVPEMLGLTTSTIILNNLHFYPVIFRIGIKFLEYKDIDAIIFFWHKFSKSSLVNPYMSLFLSTYHFFPVSFSSLMIQEIICCFLECFSVTSF